MSSSNDDGTVAPPLSDVDINTAVELTKQEADRLIGR